MHQFCHRRHVSDPVPGFACCNRHFRVHRAGEIEHQAFALQFFDAGYGNCGGGIRSHQDCSHLVLACVPTTLGLSRRKCLNIRLAHLFVLAHAVKKEVSFDPLHIRLFSANAAVLYTNTVPQLVE